VWSDQALHLLGLPLTGQPHLIDDNRVVHVTSGEVERWLATRRAPKWWNTHRALVDARLTEGCKLFAHVSDGVPVHRAWLTMSATRIGSDFGFWVGTNTPIAVLWDDFTEPSARRGGLQKASIASRVRLAQLHGESLWAMATVRPDNSASLRSYEASGFKVVATLHRACRFGRVRGRLTSKGEGLETLHLRLEG